jgi:hypothetical protein
MHFMIWKSISSPADYMHILKQNSGATSKTILGVPNITVRVSLVTPCNAFVAWTRMAYKMAILSTWWQQWENGTCPKMAPHYP